MKFQRFEELPVWRDAIEMAVKVYEMTSAGAMEGRAGLRDQLERAAVSVSNNIAEGYERGTLAELVSFLYVARGSAGEVRSMLHLLERLPLDDEPRAHLASLIPLATSISRQLGGWLEALKNSESKGQRYQNDATRQTTQTARRRDAFLSELRRLQDERGTSPPRIVGESSSNE